MAITFDLTDGSRSNLCMNFRRLFSLGLLWNHNFVMSSGRPDLTNGSKWPYLLIRSLDRAQISARVSGGRFPWGFYRIVTWWRQDLVGQTWVTGQNGITFDPTVGWRSNFCTSFRRPFSLGFLCNCYSVRRRYGRPDLSNESKLT
jgi:hypothetical protein